MKTPHISSNTESSKAIAHHIGNGLSFKAPHTIQMKRVGHVPTVPGGFRGTTTLAYDGSGVPQGGKVFHGGQTAAVRADNNVNGGGAAPVIGVGAHNQSDIGGGALMERTMVSNIEPEVDHIVPRAEGGANDHDNARVLSKTQNNAGGIARPNAAQKSLRAYETFDIGLTAGMAVTINDGDVLGAIDAGRLATYAGIGPLANPGAYTGADVTTMIAAGNGTANGIDIA